jgi:hippurate hydrolase
MSVATPVTDEDFVALRHRLHAAPELAYEEHETAALVSTYLREWGYEVVTGVGRTGVVGTLRIGAGERSVAIRADMDALPIEEATGLDYASRNPAAMMGTRQSCCRPPESWQQAASFLVLCG